MLIFSPSQNASFAVSVKITSTKNHTDLRYSTTSPEMDLNRLYLQTHTSAEHNFANYMFFLTHLLDKPDTEYTGQVSERRRADFQFWSSLSLSRRVMFGKCIKVGNGTSFLWVIVFDGSMSRAAAERPQQTVNTTAPFDVGHVGLRR